MISSSWGAPKAFTKGLSLQHVEDGCYEDIYMYTAGPMLILSYRFYTGYVWSALSSNMIRFFQTPSCNICDAFRNWIMPDMPGLIVDFVISLDDRFLYFSNWLHGDVRQYNIEDPSKSVLTRQLWVGGLIQKGSQIVVVSKDEVES
ncbi:Selenium-binding protein 1 [Nymphaea thermarum]|nr:Selenium-binding protein 1 [Nymphaea thermarum]